MDDETPRGCIEPGLVTLADLAAFAAGEADERSTAHIRACTACAAESRAIAAAGNALGRLFRVDCPSPQTLGELTLYMLDADEARLIRTHVAMCPHCAAEAAALHAALSVEPLSDAVAPSGLFARIVARLLPAPAQRGALAGVRGGPDDTLSYDADGVTITLALEPDVSGSERRWTLLALVVDEAGGRAIAGAPALLRQGDEVAAEAAVDETGNVVFEALPRGSYELDLYVSDRVIAVDGIEIGPHVE
jgi:hypothetical protein